MRETNSPAVSKASLFPLTVLAAVFFIPSYSYCGHAPKSPLGYASEGWLSVAWIVPVFACAAALALLTLRVLARGEPDRASRRLALGSVALFVVAQVIIGAGITLDSSREWNLLVFPAIAMFGAAALIRSARGKRPWQIWERVLAAFALMVPTTGPAFYLGGSLLLERGAGLAIGGYLFDAAVLALWAILGVAMFRSREVAAPSKI
jgi:hypothetical protein